MSYKVLYRKYRPDSFDNIVGQSYIVRTLKNSIINNAFSHSYIFSGPRGTGKTSTAKVFAKAINCINPIDGSPCNKCEFCLNYKENPDIIEIDAASNNGVDQIRELIDNIKLSPTNGKYKIYIIDEVHMLTSNAFNALLLTLEEPPKHAIFIFATTNIESVPSTILSRCQRFDFQKINTKDIVDNLSRICKLENINIDEDALEEIADISEGGMRDSLSLLDQLSKANEKITLKDIENDIKIVSNTTVESLLSFLELNSYNEFIELVESIKESNCDYKYFVKKVINCLTKKAKSLRSNRLNPDDYKDIILNLVDSINKMNINVNSYDIFILFFLKYFDQTIKESNSSQKSISEGKIKDDNIVKPNIIDDMNFIKIRINNAFFGANKVILDDFKAKFENLKYNTEIDGVLKRYIVDAVPVVLSSTNLILKVDNDHMAKDANSKLNEIEILLNKYTDMNIKVIYISEIQWQDEKNSYIKNIKNNYQYKYIEECTTNDNNEDVSDVFDISKVEII